MVSDIWPGLFKWSLKGNAAPHGTATPHHLLRLALIPVLVAGVLLDFAVFVVGCTQFVWAFETGEQMPGMEGWVGTVTAVVAFLRISDAVVYSFNAARDALKARRRSQGYGVGPQLTATRLDRLLEFLR